MQRIQITRADVENPEKLRERLDRVYANIHDLLGKLTEIQQAIPRMQSSGLSPSERLLLQQLAVGSTDNPISSQTPVLPTVTALPPAAATTSGTMVRLSTDGRAYVFNGATQNWDPIGAAAPSDMMTTDTNQAIPAAVKTWAVAQIFNGGLTAGALAALAAITGTTIGSSAGVSISSGGLAITGGQIASTTQFGCWAYNSAAQSINSGTPTVLTFDTEFYDRGAVHDVAVSTGRMTVPAGGGGLWSFWAVATFAANAAGSRSLTLRGNGGLSLANATIQANTVAAAVTAFPIMTPGPVPLIAGDYVEVLATQDSGGALNVSSGLGVTGFGAFKYC